METKLQKFTNQTITNIEINQDETEVIFTLLSGQKIKMFHEQDCCESVYLNDIIGDLSSIINKQLYDAYLITNSYEKDYEEIVWSFYTFVTFDSCVTLRWIGSSNGYYSVSVDLQTI